MKRIVMSDIVKKLGELLKEYTTGIEYKNKYYKYPWKITTGLSSLDEIINGGLYPYRAYLFYGEAGTGKSQLAMQIAASGVLIGREVGKDRVIYIDTEGSFNPDRVLTFLRYLIKKSNIKSEGEVNLYRLLNSILVGKVRNIDSLLLLLDKSLSFIDRSILLLVDNIANPLLTIEKRTPAILFKILRRILNRLVILSGYPISIVITSRVYSLVKLPISSALQPYGGITLGGFIDYEILLSRENNIIKLINVYGNKVAYMKITSEGIVEA